MTIMEFDRILILNNKNHLNKFGDSEELHDTFYELCMLLTKEKTRDTKLTFSNMIDCRINRLTGYIERKCSLEIGRKLVQLKTAIQLEINDSYQRGKNEGKSLLKMLNNGDITLKELE